MKIIHIVENLDKGAVENWLVNVFIESKKIHPEWEWTFYCILGREGRLDEKVLGAGGKIIFSPYWISDKYRFLKSLRHTLRNGNFDIIHSHHDYLSGFYLLATAGLNFRKRILHIHNTDKALPVGNALLRKVLLRIFHIAAVHYSDLIVGISKDTLTEFIHGRRINKKTAILYYGIDLTAFSIDPGKQWLRKELAIPENGKVILFIGRMTELKNPVFVIDILHEISKMRQDTYAVLVGKGHEEESVVQRAKMHGISDKVKLLGWRNDGAAIMMASDVFVFPRIEYPKEGLGLVVVEAQAAGLPMLLSHGIVDDAIVIPELAQFLPLNNNPNEWAKAAVSVIDNPSAIDRKEAYECMQLSRFALANGSSHLVTLYEQSLS